MSATESTLDLNDFSSFVPALTGEAKALGFSLNETCEPSNGITYYEVRNSAGITLGQIATKGMSVEVMTPLYLTVASFVTNGHNAIKAISALKSLH
jgi:hypothetical protein